jgi:hypothetical protein
MAKRSPTFARAFAGRWRIAEMDGWEDLDLLEPAHITFVGKDGGELVFGAVEANLDVRYGASLCGNKARFAALADSAWGEAGLES